MKEEIELLQQSIEIPSVSGNERRFSLFLSKKMVELGYEVWSDPAGNIIGQIGSGTPVLLLASHLDTVAGMIPVELKEGKLYGRGAVDAKGSLISMVCAAARYIGKKFLGKIIVAGIVEEESSLRGIEELLGIAEKVDYAVFGEPSSIDRICIACKGRIHLHLTFQVGFGSSHVSSSEINKNAIHESILFWNQLKNKMQEKPFQGKTAYFSVEPNITLIHGGIATNILPDICMLDMDIRFPSGINSAQILKIIEDIIEDSQTLRGVQISYELLSQIEGYRAEKDTKLVNSLKSAIETVTNFDVKLLRKAGTNFMAIIGNTWQIPTISYGPGNPSMEHTPTEYIEITEFQKAIDVLEKFIAIILTE